MEFIFHTLAWGVIIGSNLGLAMVRAVLENIWLGGLLLGLSLLIYVLKLPAILVLTLLLPFVGALLLLMAIS
jgi:hypothetical protein